MPSVYDFRHVELDRVGRGKRRVLRPSGGGTSDIFGVMFNGSSSPKFNGSSSPKFNGSSSPNGSLNGSRRSSRSEDTQNKLFGPPEESPRKIKDYMRASPVASSASSVASSVTGTPTPVRVRVPPGGKSSGIFEGPILS